MSVWTFDCDDSGVSGTFADLLIQDASRILNSCGPDRFSFTHLPDAGFTGTALCAYENIVTILKDSTTWFKGYSLTIPRSGNMPTERIRYDIVGPWYDLERVTWQQRWKIWSIVTHQLEWQYKSRVIVGQDEAGAPLTVGEVITEILTYAIDVKGALLQLPAGDYATWGWPDVQMPLEEATNLSCADAIIRLLAFVPDYKIRFNYAASPNPEIQLVKRSSASAVSFAFGTDNIVDHSIEARNDLAVPGIVVKFERTDQVDDVSYEYIEEQTAGVTDHLNTLVITLQLAGANIRTQSCDIKVEAPPISWIEKAWWWHYVPSLAVYTTPGDLTLKRCTQEVEDDAYDFAEIPNVLEEGNVAPWIAGAKVAKVTLKLLYDYKDRNLLNQVTKEHFDETLSLQLTFTNLDTRTYSRSEGDLAEEAPAGFASSLYSAWSQLQYDGNVVLEADEVAGTVLPGDVINLTSGLAAWASMRANVQQINEQIDTGTTNIVIGPNKRIDPDTLLSLMRRFRMRMSASSHVVRTTGLSSDAEGVNTGGPAPVSQVDVAGGSTSRQVYTPQYDPEDPPTITGEIDVDPEAIELQDTSVVIKPRKIRMVEPSGVAEPPYQVVTRHLLVSDPDGEPEEFDPEEPPTIPAEECDQNGHPQDDDDNPGGGDPDDDNGDGHPQDGDNPNDPDYPGGDGDADGTGHPSDPDCYSTIPDPIT